jgi:hypothetical protein
MFCGQVVKGAHLLPGNIVFTETDGQRQVSRDRCAETDEQR